jgi:DNA-binding Lrp family transcriptional regulator
VSPGLDDIETWLRAHPREESYDLSELAERFSIAPERLRDRLRRLVDQGVLTQSEPVTGVADANPSYRLAGS